MSVFNGLVQLRETPPLYVCAFITKTIIYKPFLPGKAEKALLQGPAGGAKCSGFGN